MKLMQAALILSAALVLPAAFAADAPAAGAQVSDACKADIQKLCPDVQPGEGRIKACVKEHKDQLSSECKADMAKHRRAAKG
jgi:hypothetical protein